MLRQFLLPRLSSVDEVLTLLHSYHVMLHPPIMLKPCALPSWEGGTTTMRLFAGCGAIEASDRKLSEYAIVHLLRPDMARSKFLTTRVLLRFGRLFLKRADQTPMT